MSKVFCDDFVTYLVLPLNPLNTILPYIINLKF